MSTTVSRGIESVEFFPPPTRMSMMESLRDGPEPIVFAPASLEPLGRASEPRTRMVLGVVRVSPAPLSGFGAALEFWDSCIGGEMRKRTAEMRIHAAAAKAIHLTIRPIVMRPPRLGFSAARLN